MKRKCLNRGFTLIELLVVVLIIGILAAIALPQYQKAVVKARLASIKPILATLKTAEELYYMTHGNYTQDLAELDIETSCSMRTNDNIFQCDRYFMIDAFDSTYGNVFVAHYCPHTDLEKGLAG